MSTEQQITESDFVSLEGQFNDLLKQDKKAKARLQTLVVETAEVRAEIAGIARKMGEVSQQIGRFYSKQEKAYGGNGIRKWTRANSQ